MKLSLTGMMGAGKTSIGKILAEKINIPFYDSDQLIVDKLDLEIVDIFRNHGEDYFRKIESEILHIALHQEDNIVLSVGGGTPCFHANMDMIKNHSLSFYLDYPAKLLASRLEKGKHKRPLIKDFNPEELRLFIETTLEKRNRYYNKADYRVKNFNNPIDEILNYIQKAN